MEILKLKNTTEIKISLKESTVDLNQQKKASVNFNTRSIKMMQSEEQRD